jgi:glycosyltransferase involved in cell wall biosynthesis
VIRILHVSTDLEGHGAQSMLLRLLGALDPSRFACEVVSLADEGALGPRLREIGVPVHALGLKRVGTNLWRAGLLPGQVRRFAPHVTHTWLSLANLLGGVTARIVGTGKVLWTVRHGQVRADQATARTRLALDACARLSRRIPDHVVCCAEAALRTHAAAGYPRERMSVVPNGFDLERFRPDSAARAALRAELGVGEEESIVALVARFNPVKNHQGFIAAAARLTQVLPQARFVLCGSGIGWDNAPLATWIRAADLAERFILLPERADIERLLVACEIVTLSSLSEGFPNVLAEAMACGVPCVATEVGNAREIVGDTGRVVARNDPEALASGWADLLRLSHGQRAALGAAARQRIGERFPISGIARRYEELYAALAGEERARIVASSCVAGQEG